MAGILGVKSVIVTIPLLIRLMEFAREDAKSDLDLHFVAERASECGDAILDMYDYNDLIKGEK